MDARDDTIFRNGVIRATTDQDQPAESQETVTLVILSRSLLNSGLSQCSRIPVWPTSPTDTVLHVTGCNTRQK